ncbi:MAG TPA: hypothetical protein VK151_08595 [Fluviicola sp.]|nr:hypothetical protein [Fluviicola sp.]
MAEYSIEYYQAIGDTNVEGDFSILVSFEYLPDGKSVSLCSEVFGNHSIQNLGGHCHLFY